MCNIFVNIQVKYFYAGKNSISCHLINFNLSELNLMIQM